VGHSIFTVPSGATDTAAKMKSSFEKPGTSPKSERRGSGAEGRPVLQVKLMLFTEKTRTHCECVWIN
jgi:hypothetical protein